MSLTDAVMVIELDCVIPDRLAAVNGPAGNWKSAGTGWRVSESGPPS